MHRPKYHHVLAVLHTEGPTTPRRLAMRLGAPHDHIDPMLGMLIRMGLVTVLPDNERIGMMPFATWPRSFVLMEQKTRLASRPHPLLGRILPHLRLPTRHAA